MDENDRKLVILDLALALIVFALFGMASLTFNSRHADPELIQVASDVDLYNDAGTSPNPGSRMPVLHRVAMETTDESTPLTGFAPEILNDSGSGAISNP